MLSDVPLLLDCLLTWSMGVRSLRRTLDSLSIWPVRKPPRKLQRGSAEIIRTVGFSTMILWWVRTFNEFEVAGAIAPLRCI